MWMCLLILALPALALGQITNFKPYNVTATALFFDVDTNRNGNLERQEMDVSFEKYDTDRNGRVSRAEFNSYLEAHSPNLHDANNALFDIYDVDNDHILDQHDYDHFYNLMNGDDIEPVTHFEFVRYWSILLEAIEHSLNGFRKVETQ